MEKEEGSELVVEVPEIAEKEKRGEEDVLPEIPKTSVVEREKS